MAMRLKVSFASTMLFFHLTGTIDKQLCISVLYFFNDASKIGTCFARLKETNDMEGIKLDTERDSERRYYDSQWRT